MMELLKGANLLVRFVLELCALGAVGYWSFRTGGGVVAKVVLGVGGPLLLAVVWGVLVSPRAPVRLPVPLSLLVQALVFGVAVAALVATGHRTLGWAFAAVVVVNVALLYAWGQ